MGDYEQLGPVGIQVSRIESRLFLELNAVLIPITTNAFLSPLSEPMVAPPSDAWPPFWFVRATANSISNEEIDLSRDLKRRRRRKKS